MYLSTVLKYSVLNVLKYQYFVLKYWYWCSGKYFVLKYCPPLNIFVDYSRAFDTVRAIRCSVVS